MLYNFLAPLGDEMIFFNIFRYLTFRTGGALMTAFALTLWLGPKIILWLKARQGEGQPIRTDGPETHLKKKGTPTMGGVMIMLAVTVSTLLWVDLANIYYWLLLFVFLGFGAIGFFDDDAKLRKKSHNGISGKKRLVLEGAVALLAVLAFMAVAPAHLSDVVKIPFFKDVKIDLGYVFIPFAVLVVVGAANAVNLTDGLDGLVIGPIMIAAACFGGIAYLVGHAIFSQYLFIPFIPEMGEVSVFMGAVIGAGLGFLWFNASPAEVFMGDTGSLSLGAALGMTAVLTKHELVLAIVGGLFVIETLSVMIQVMSFKLTGKRVFKMAPIHHHFEKLGWAETKVVMRFWIIAILFAVIGLATLKLR
jgi:phospho-N-acetylmuramoyl-pentapeptide-transferase